MTAVRSSAPTGPSPVEVLRNRPFLLLWLSQLATQVGGNMVVFGLTIIVFDATGSSSAVSLLLLTFLAPAVLFSAVAGVFVDRIDRRRILLLVNVLRFIAFAAMFLLERNLLALYLLNVAVATLNVFFAPAEAAMIPTLVPRSLLLAANSLFTFTLNAAFAIGFALLGPLVVQLAGAHALILVVAAFYLLAAAFCFTLPVSPPPLAGGAGLADAERAVESTIAQLREGLAYIRANATIGWSLIYLGIAASLIGVLGVIGPDFAVKTLGLRTQDFVVVVLPLGLGVVLGILALNSYGRYLPRRRVIEAGLVALGILVALLTLAGPISRFLQGVESSTDLGLSSFVSLLAVVVVIAFVAGIAYALVAIPAQTQLQEELPEDVRGRVFGVLYMLVSVASFLPIIVVGPVVDLLGTTVVITIVGVIVLFSGISSIALRGPLQPSEAIEMADLSAYPPGPIDAVAIAYDVEAREPHDSAGRAVVALGSREVELRLEPDTSVPAGRWAKPEAPPSGGSAPAAPGAGSGGTAVPPQEAGTRPTADQGAG